MPSERHLEPGDRGPPDAEVAAVAKVDAVTLACCADLVDRYATMTVVNRALIVLERRVRANRHD